MFAYDFMGFVSKPCFFHSLLYKSWFCFHLYSEENIAVGLLWWKSSLWDVEHLLISFIYRIKIYDGKELAAVESLSLL